jgi:DNA-binding protein HU-beta
MSMYKTELIRRVARETRLSQRVVGDVVEATQRLIEQTLRAGHEVRLPGFGSFSTRKRQASKVKHIRTGEVITVPARTIAAFRAGEILKRAVAGKRRRKSARG